MPVDFIVLDIDCNLSCPIILGRPFFRTIGVISDMKEGNIRFQFPLKKGMEHFPGKKVKLPMNLSCGLLMNLVPKMALVRSIFALFLARALNDSASWEATQFSLCFLFFSCLEINLASTFCLDVFLCFN